MMASHGRPSPRTFSRTYTEIVLQAMAMSLCLACIPFGFATGQSMDWPMADSWYRDAQLTDVCFTDPQTGWVVGDRGTVLQTVDGGEDWHRVDVGPTTGLRFESVFFVNTQIGWIVGGIYNPRASSSQAVILKTVDGGNSWQHVDARTIPKLNLVRFQDPANGWAVGEGNAHHPSGILKTSDGGRTWSSRPGGGLKSWQFADRLGDRMVLAGMYFQLGINEKKLKAAYLAETAEVDINQIMLSDAKPSLAVGNQGSLLTTDNGGRTWHPQTRFDAGQRADKQFDLRTLFSFGKHIWVAGRPGTYIFRIDTDTGSWTKIPTRSRHSINRLFFIDEQTGWAVGNSGQILSTNDGGLTWRRQRNGIARLAVLQMVHHESQICAEAFAMYCSNDHFYGGALVVSSKGDSEGYAASVRLGRAQQACSRLGSSFVETCLTPADRHGTVGELVRQIRLVRPNVISLPGDDARARAAQFQSLVVAAVELAADDTAYESQISELGLTVWQVKRVVLHHRGNTSRHTMSSYQFLTRLSCLLCDFVTPSRILLGQNELDHLGVSFSTIYAAPQVSTGHDLIPNDFETRRKDMARSNGNLTLMRQLARKKQTLKRLGELRADSPRSKAHWMREISESTAGLDDVTSGIWLSELGNIYERQGQSELAGDIYSFLARRYSHHPLNVSALRWLYHHYSSEEKAIIHQRELDGAPKSIAETKTSPQIDPLTRPVTTIENGVAKTIWQPVEPDAASTNTDPRQSPISEVDRIESINAQIVGLPAKRYRKAKIISQSLGIVDFACAQSEFMLLQQAKLNYRLDPAMAIEKQLRAIATQSTFPWVAVAAKREMQLAGSAHGDIAFQLICSRQDAPPTLDGAMNEPFWQAPAGQSRAELQHARPGADFVRFGCDADFLYVAIECQKREGIAYPPASSPRIRDADLSSNDRCEIAIDIDRDCTTFFLFSIDSQGRVADSCGGNVAWNPNWYVASRQNDQHWYAEAAIPLSEIRNENTDRHWGISIKRFAGAQFVGAWPGQSKNNLSLVTPVHSNHRLVLASDRSIHEQPIESFGILTLPVTAFGEFGQESSQPDSQNNDRAK